jgi:uncharacterized RDD family membrane protein YckC
MNCPNCGAALAPGDRFCQTCGSAALVDRSCAVCGVRLSPTAAFCAGCGAPVGAVSAAAPAAFAPPPPPFASDAWAPPPPPVASGDWAVPPPPVAADRPKLRYRGVFIRFLAALVDSILYTGVAWMLAGSAGLGATSADGFDLNGTPAMMLSLASFGYYVVFEGLFGGTIGKLILGLRVVNRKGRSPGIGAALVRNILRIVDFLPLFYVVGVIAVLASEKKQRVGDRVAGTYVISR